MSVDYSAELYYGYILPYDEDRVNTTYLDEKSGLVYDVLEFDPYDCWQQINAYDDNSDFIIGIKIDSTMDYCALDEDSLFNRDKYDKQLYEALKLFAVDIGKAKNDKPQFYLVNRIW